MVQVTKHGHQGYFTGVCPACHCEFRTNDTADFITANKRHKNHVYCPECEDFTPVRMKHVAASFPEEFFTPLTPAKHK